MDIRSIFFSMKVYCVFSLESLHRGDSDEYTIYHFQHKHKKIAVNYSNLQPLDFFSRDSRTSSKQPC